MLEDKIDQLTKEIVALRLAYQGESAKAAPAASKKAVAKVAEPEHDVDEVGTTMRKAAKKDKPAVQKYIKSKKCADLADLLTKPELHDDAFEFASGILDAEDDEDEV
jgi:hypothetical protein